MKYAFKKKRYLWLAWALDALGYPLKAIFAPFKRRVSAPENRHFLIVRLDHMGDILMTTPVPKSLKESFAGCRVSYLVPSWGEPLLRNNPFIDDVIIYDPPWFARDRYHRSAKSPGFFATAQRLRSMRFTAALGLRGDIRENLLMALAGIPERVGYGVTGGGFLLTRELDQRTGVHESEHVKDVLTSIGAQVALWEPKIYFADSEEAAFEDRFQGLGLSPRDKYIGAQTDAGAPSKEWPEKHWAEFLKLFRVSYPNYKVVLIGTDGSKTKALARPGVIDLTGKTSLRELLLLMRKLHLFIGPDSGPTHAAAALGTRTLFLYSGTNRFERWKPLSENAETLRNDVPCSPCENERCHVTGHPCMDLITPDDVLSAVSKRLD